MPRTPNPHCRYPVTGPIERLGFLKNFITHPHIEVGDYTYFDSPEGPRHFEDNVLYHFEFLNDKLIIGKFCQIAAQTIFIMNGAHHATDGFSTFPFSIFGGTWSTPFRKDPPRFPHKGDTNVGHDVWFGYRSTILPGVTIGHGAIIASHAVVTQDVPAYTLVAGNPARIIKQRFSDSIIQDLQDIAWWHWPIHVINKNIQAIVGQDIEHLRCIAEHVCTTADHEDL